MFFLSNSIDKSTFCLFNPSYYDNFSDVYKSLVCFYTSSLFYVVSASSFIFINKIYFLLRFAISIWLYANCPWRSFTIAVESCSLFSTFSLFLSDIFNSLYSYSHFFYSLSLCSKCISFSWTNNNIFFCYCLISRTCFSN